MRRVLLGLLVAGLCLGASRDEEEEAEARVEAYADVISWRRDDAAWRSPTVRERTGMRAIARDLLLGREACTARGVRRAEETAAELGFEVEPVTIDGDALIIVREGREAFGAGLLAVRCGPAEPVVWQAPHPFYDLRTGDIVLRLFVESDARAAQWATHHRFRALEDEERSDSMHPADVADEPGSLFQAATVGLHVGDPELRFVQVHGFAQRSAPRTKAVISSGDSRHPLRQVGDRLEPIVGRVAVFGLVDLPLGGQQNAQGRVLPHGRFLHLELAPSTRKKLLDDPDLRRRLSRGIGDGPW